MLNPSPDPACEPKISYAGITFTTVTLRQGKQILKARINTIKTHLIIGYDKINQNGGNEQLREHYIHT